MSSYIVKGLIGNEFDKVIKGFGGGDKDEQDEDNGISGEELVAEENRRAANEKERKARQAKVEKEREEARQKIRDKYNIQKKDDPSTKTKNQQQGKTNGLVPQTNNPTPKVEKINAPEPQGFDPVKMTTDAFNSLKQKFGWK